MRVRHRFFGSLAVAIAFLLLVSLGSATDLRNIERITPQGASIMIDADLKMNQTNITGIGSGMTNITSTGQLQMGNSIDLGSNRITSLQNPSSSQDAATFNWVDTNFLYRDGSDSMAGNLDMSGNAIVNIDWASSDDGTGSGLDADTLDGTQLSGIDWADVAMAQSDVSASDVGLGNVRNVDLSTTGGSFVAYDTGNEEYNVQAGSMSWGDLGISQSDVSVSNLGAADANLDMNENEIQNIDGLQDGTGSNTIHFDGSNNVEIPNGNLGVGTSPSYQIDVDGDINTNGFLRGSVGRIGIGTGSNMGYNADASGADHIFRDSGGSTVARFYEGGNVEIPNGNLGVGKTPGNTLDLNTGGTSDGISFDGQTALSGYSGNNWLRLNQDSQFSNGVYTPGYFRADGGAEFRGNLDMQGNNIVDVAGISDDDDEVVMNSDLDMNGQGLRLSVGADEWD